MVEHRTLLQSFKYAVDGVKFAIKDNQNLRIHLVAAIIVVILSIFYKVGAYEMGILGVMILLVISTEMINTSIEEMTNLITKEHRQEAKIAKDVAAGMVLLTSIGSVIVGVLIFLPYILKSL